MNAGPFRKFAKFMLLNPKKHLWKSQLSEETKSYPMHLLWCELHFTHQGRQEGIRGVLDTAVCPMLGKHPADDQSRTRIYSWSWWEWVTHQDAYIVCIPFKNAKILIVSLLVSGPVISFSNTCLTFLPLKGKTSKLYKCSDSLSLFAVAGILAEIFPSNNYLMSPSSVYESFILDSHSLHNYFAA